MTTKRFSLEAHNAAQAKAADLRHQPVIELYASGLNMREVAKRSGVCFQRVGHIIKRARKRGLLT